MKDKTKLLNQIFAIFNLKCFVCQSKFLCNSGYKTISSSVKSEINTQSQSKIQKHFRDFHPCYQLTYDESLITSHIKILSLHRNFKEMKDSFQLLTCKISPSLICGEYAKINSHLNNTRNMWFS